MHVDALIVGGGIIGVSILRKLAESGLKVMLIDERRSGLGATAYSGAMVRVAHPKSDEIAAAGEGLIAYRSFPEESQGRVSLHESGHLYFGTYAELKSILPEVLAVSSGTELLDRDEIAVRWPAMKVTAEAALLEPKAGYGDPIAFVRHQINMAVKAGACVAEAIQLHNLCMGDSGITGAQTSLGRIEARSVVLAAGAHTPQLLEKYGFCLGIHKLWSQKIQVSNFVMGAKTDNLPGFIDHSRGLNGVPAIGQNTYSIGFSTHLHIKANDFTGYEAEYGHAMHTRNIVQALMPSTADAVFIGAMCHVDCYGTTSIGVIGQCQSLPEGLLLATGFSGGGFKMAPYAARRISEYLAGNR